MTERLFIIFTGMLFLEVLCEFCTISPKVYVAVWTTEVWALTKRSVMSAWQLAMGVGVNLHSKRTSVEDEELADILRW